MNEKRLLILSSILVIALIGMIGYQSYHIHNLTTHIQNLQIASVPTVPMTGTSTQPAAPSVTINPKSGQPMDPFQGLWDDSAFGSDEWNPFDEIQRMQQHMDRMFSSTLNRVNASPSFGPLAMDSTYLPELDLKDEGDHYVVTVDLPGLENSQVDIQVEGRNLSIAGMREAATEEADNSGKVIRSERNLGKFERTVVLPGPVDKDSVEANYEDGVLKITLPKSTDSGESRKIPLNSGNQPPAS
ncbi:MAG: Hsp20/alpha crystallin family protein [Candidatus Omnitrophica bacterium]|nr:Hsp20/alpha crystallin family protein [Candidatus Omnitrophota bacterium]MCA9435584.1 Hsp20/alpha crystallin family protein [Candidatus Omnitrophota bacterium]MCA9446199.1 Hsp20/alpha crystallin family protein [Candidatus Omnitrophota bacterium]